jgi:homoserine dehydrogenase
VRLGLLGCGNVGAALVGLIGEQADAIEARTGLRLEVTRVAVRNLAKARSVDLPAELLTHDADAVVQDPEVDLVIELIGGIEPARSLVFDALKAGKPVVTANKELVANVGPELFAAAEGAGVDLLFEAAVGGAIPVVRALRESLAGSSIRRITGIVNGTTNYILTRMSEEGATYADALAEAQSLGYAERDPTADVEGYDAGAKVAILATIAFGASVVAGDVAHEGISGVTPADIAFAHRLGYEVKLLAVAEQGDDGRVAVRVHPAMVPAGHPLASVRGSFNAVFIEGEALGELMLYGRGAGGRPTASAVLGDVVDAAGNLRGGTCASIGALPRAIIRPVDDARSEYYLHIEVLDRPGVLHAVSGVFAQHDVSIRSMEQEGLGDEARLIFITHDAAESDIQATLGALRSLDAVDRVTSVLRVVAE